MHLDSWHWTDQTLKKWKNVVLEEKWARLLEVREEVLKALEEKRISNEIHSSLEAKIILYTEKPDLKKFLKENTQLLPSLFITSQVEIVESRPATAKKSDTALIWISVEKCAGAKCNRCWNYSETVGSDKEFQDICQRCVDVVRKR